MKKSLNFLKASKGMALLALFTVSLLLFVLLRHYFSTAIVLLVYLVCTIAIGSVFIADQFRRDRSPLTELKLPESDRSMLDGSGASQTAASALITAEIVDGNRTNQR